MAAALTAARASADIIASCGFESSGDSWSFHSAGGALNADPGSADLPAGQRILDGSQSWLVRGTTSVLSFDEVLLSGWTSVVVEFRVSSTATDGGPGNMSDDAVEAYVATAAYSSRTSPAFGSTRQRHADRLGRRNDMGIQQRSAAQVKPLGWGGVLRPADSGPRTTDGFTDIGIQVPNGYRSLALKISATNDSQKKCWNIDDVVVTGSPTSSNDCWWDGDGSGTVGGGSGTWDNTSATPWASDSGGASHCAWKSANGDNARFTQSGGTVTIGQGTSVAARS